MTKLIIPIFILCLFSISCKDSKKIKIPPDVLSPDTMVDVLTDVHLVQASQRMGAVLDSADTGTSTSFVYVWKKHRISEAEYNKCLDFYSHNPALLDSIYENVLSNLSKQKAVLLGKKPVK